jgi:hypothetical protein
MLYLLSHDETRMKFLTVLLNCGYDSNMLGTATQEEKSRRLDCWYICMHTIWIDIGVCSLAIEYKTSMLDYKCVV